MVKFTVLELSQAPINHHALHVIEIKVHHGNFSPDYRPPA